MRMVIIGNFQLTVFQSEAFARSWYVFSAFTHVNEKNVCTFVAMSTLLPRHGECLFYIFSLSLLHGQTSGVKVHSEAVGGPKLHQGRTEKQAEHHRFTSAVSCWFACNMTSGCGCGEQMIQAVCCRLCYDDRVFHIHGV